MYLAAYFRSLILVSRPPRMCHGFFPTHLFIEPDVALFFANADLEHDISMRLTEIGRAHV